MSEQSLVAEETLPLWAASPQKQSDCWTVRSVFNKYRRPDSDRIKSANAVARRIDLWERFTGNLPIDQMSTEKLREFQSWLEQLYPLPTGGSSINKAVDEIRRVLEIARKEALPVGPFRSPTKHRVTTRPRFYFTDEQVGQLWEACEKMTWPPKQSYRSFAGTGLDAPVFWRAVIVLLRNYGMRVQDLVAYSRGKSPLLWQDVTFEELSPNVESQERWRYGWLQYTASKTEKSSGRKYVLPLTPSARGALNRLSEAAISQNGRLVPMRRVLPCPFGKSFSVGWQRLQLLAGVKTRTGEPYMLEDFRKTVGTAVMPVHSDLAFAICGWGRSGDVGDKHYKNPEPLLVQKILDCPLPSCFEEWHAD